MRVSFCPSSQSGPSQRARRLPAQMNENSRATVKSQLTRRAACDKMSSSAPQESAAPPAEFRISAKWDRRMEKFVLNTATGLAVGVGLMLLARE